MISKFTDLITWKESHKLVLLVYKLLEKFPSKEQYALSDQIRRSSVSISSNIAEGFSRQGKGEKLQFYHIAKGSLTELENQFMIARDVNYLTTADFRSFEVHCEIVGKLITGLIKSVRNF